VRLPPRPTQLLWTTLSAALAACSGANAGPEVTATPTFGSPGGTYTSVVPLVVECATPDATIRFTLDGSEPTASSQAYQVPIPIASTTTVKAVATAPGLAASAVATVTYVIASGDLDPSFRGAGAFTVNLATPNDFANAVALQPDGKIVAAGVTVSNGFWDFALLRFHPDGETDTSFGVGGVQTTDFAATNDVVQAIALQPDGKILAAGTAHTAAALARYDADGFLDPSFDGDGKVTVALGAASSAIRALVVLEDGKILVAGWADEGTGWNDMMAARFAADGSLDPSFGSGGVARVPFGTGFDEAYALAVQPDGRIVLAGRAEVAGSAFDMALARLEPDGALDLTFGSGGKVTTDFEGWAECAYGVAVLPGGEIVAGGSAIVAIPYLVDHDFALVRYTAAGALDGTFGAGGKVTTDFHSPTSRVGDQAFGMAIQDDGKIVLAGQAWDRDFGAARYLPDGSLDWAFGAWGIVRTDFALPEDDDAAHAVAIQPDGKIVVAGRAQTVYGYQAQNDWGIVRYLP
jgi:uncharacterized delta-60 repeat protein